MKYALTLPVLAASTFAATIPTDIQRRTAAPVCQFDARSLETAAFEAPVSKRDLGQTTWNPPSNLVKALQEVWAHEKATYSEFLTFKNYGYDQVMAGKGKINYCVRWESTDSVTAEQRAQVETTISKQFNKWISVLAGFEKFPYSKVEVKVVGWAVKDKNLLKGDTSGIQVYTDLDAGGVAQCSEDCGRFFHQDNNYSKCKAGADRHYDQSLWLTKGFNGGFGGAGGDWGQRIPSEYFMQNINAENIHILLHEIGHTFALDDFYDWTPTGVTNFIMNAGSATEITEFDAWMARDWWRNLKSRYGL